MAPHFALRACHVLLMVLSVTASEDFDWTKTDKGSFYYGTFPTGTAMCDDAIVKRLLSSSREALNVDVSDHHARCI